MKKRGSPLPKCSVCGRFCHPADIDEHITLYERIRITYTVWCKKCLKEAIKCGWKKEIKDERNS